MYPYVIPFSGAAFARDPTLRPHTEVVRRHVAGTDIEWDQPAKILPIDPQVRDVILEIESEFERTLQTLESRAAHLPSRVRSLVWILAGAPVLERHGMSIGVQDEIRAELEARLPVAQPRRTAVRAVAGA